MANVDDNGRRTAPKAPPRRKPRGMLDVLPVKKGSAPKVYRPKVIKPLVKEIKHTQRVRQVEAKDTKGDRLPEKERQRIVDDSMVKLANHVVEHPKENRDTELVRNLKRLRLVETMHGYPIKGEALLASESAPVLKILDQTTRPLHAIAGATDAAITGGDVVRAAKRGIQNKDKVTFSKVLKDAGAPKVVQGVGGFALDVGLDPTTYLTAGTGSVARNAAMKAAKDTERRALRSGLTAEQATRFGERAATQAAKKAPAGKGVTLKFAGHGVPGVTRSTAATGQVVKKVADKAPTRVKTTAGGAKNVVRDVRPTMAPAGVPAAEFQKVHNAAAESRAQQSLAQAHAQTFARAVQKHVPDAADRELVIAALEHKTIGKLPERLREQAVMIRSELKGQKRKAIHAGLAVKDVTKRAGEGEAKGYFPHASSEALHAGDGVVEPVRVEGVGRRQPKTGSMQHRTDRRPIDVINAETPGKVSTDAPLVLANHLAALGTAGAHARFNRVLADIGRPVKFGDVPAKGEAIYAIKGAHIHPVEPGMAEIKGGRYVALNRELAESELASVKPIAEATSTGRAFNKFNRGFKTVATMTPGFHVRNAIGDTMMGYLAQPGHRLVVNTAKSARLLKEARRQEAQVRGLMPPVASGKTIKVNGRIRSLDVVARGSRENAAAQTGYIGRELNDLVGRKADGEVKKVRRGRGRVKRLMQDRENLMRGATYLHGLDKGLTGSEAGRLSRDTHIDYGDLTTFERQARRAMPFYTFSARSIPLHAKRLITNPGKFAAYEKVREEAMNYFGIDPGQLQQGMSEYQQLQAGVPVKQGKNTFSVNLGLPLTSLNQLPIGTPSEIARNEANFFMSMITPIIKDPVEWGMNKSFFTHSDIERAESPTVAAPAWVKVIYKQDRKLADKLGIVPDYIDRRTGKKTWGWNGKSDYVASLIPGPGNIIKQLTMPGSNRAGQGTQAKILSAATGIKPSLVDPVTQHINDLYDQLEPITRELGALSHREKTRANTIARVALNQKARKLEREIWLAAKARGDVVLPKSGRPASVRPPSSGLGGGLGGGIGGGLGGGL